MPTDHLFQGFADTLEVIGHDTGTRQDQPDRLAKGVLIAAPVLRPTGAWCKSMGGEDLACACLVCHVLKTMPLGCHQEQRLPVQPSEHAGEAATVKGDRLQDLTHKEARSGENSGCMLKWLLTVH